MCDNAVINKDKDKECVTISSQISDVYLKHECVFKCVCIMDNTIKKKSIYNIDYWLPEYYISQIIKSKNINNCGYFEYLNFAVNENGSIYSISGMPNLGKTIDYSLYKNEEDMIAIFYDIVFGVCNLHKFGIIHHDIKSDNILIDKDKNVNIIDYTHSLVIDLEFLDKYNGIGTYAYMPPEVLKNKKQHIFSSKIDAWSLGVILLELVMQKNIYSILDIEYDKDVISKKYSDNNFPNEINDILNYVPYEKIKDFVKNLLKQDENLRMHPNDLLTEITLIVNRTIDTNNKNKLYKTIDYDLQLINLKKFSNFFNEKTLNITEKNYACVIKTASKIPSKLCDCEQLNKQIFDEWKKSEKNNDFVVDTNYISNVLNSKIYKKNSVSKIIHFLYKMSWIDLKKSDILNINKYGHPYLLHAYLLIDNMYCLSDVHIYKFKLNMKVLLKMMMFLFKQDDVMNECFFKYL